MIKEILLEIMAWVCTNNPAHVFDEKPNGGEIRCPKCKILSFLVDSGTLDTDYQDELGLCILLMDASTSMTQHNIPPSKKTRLDLVSEIAAQGVFDLQGISKSKETYICAIGFSKSVQTLFFDSVNNLIDKYNGDVDAFARFINKELSKMPGDTNINAALTAAYSLVQKFINKELLALEDYEVLHHAMWTHDKKDIDIPNVRVLLYTDGSHNVPTAMTPIINPFSEMEPDILIGAFIGRENHEGCIKLKNVISNCPEHNQPQFFILDHFDKLGTLRKLFHMASGTSGFCVKCLKK